MQQNAPWLTDMYTQGELGSTFSNNLSHRTPRLDHIQPLAKSPKVAWRNHPVRTLRFFYQTHQLPYHLLNTNRSIYSKVHGILLVAHRLIRQEITSQSSHKLVSISEIVRISPGLELQPRLFRAHNTCRMRRGNIQLWRDPTGRHVQCVHSLRSSVRSPAFLSQMDPVSVEVTNAPSRTTIHPWEARRSRYTHRTSGSRSSTPPSTSLVLRHAHTRPGPVITLPAPSSPAASTTSPSPSLHRLRYHHSAPCSKAPPTAEDTNTHRWCWTILLPSHDSLLL